MLQNILQYIELMRESATEIVDELAELQAYVSMVQEATQKTGSVMVPILSDQLIAEYAKTAQKLIANPEK